MPRLAWLTFLLCAPAAPAETGALPEREVLSYKVEWRLITAGRARLEWSAGDASQPGWRIRLQMQSTGLVSKLFKVDNDYSAVLDSALCAQSSHLIAHEGRRHRDTTITFDAETRKANYLERDIEKDTVVRTEEIDVPACVHDVPGSLFYLRTLQLEPGQSTEVAVSDGKKSVSARVEAQQREEVKTPAGTFKTVRYEAFLFNNVLYRRNARLYVWLTDDARKLPVQIRVRMQFTIGTITLQLENRE
jgi:hypothetical protein